MARPTACCAWNGEKKGSITWTTLVKRTETPVDAIGLISRILADLAPGVSYHALYASPLSLSFHCATCSATPLGSSCLRRTSVSMPPKSSRVFGPKPCVFRKS